MPDTAIIPDRLAALETLTLDKGAHGNFDDGHCAMEVVAWLAGEHNITDAPQCASTALATFTISLNDRWDEPTRQKLKPYLPRMVGTRDDGQDEARSYLALDWLIRSYTPTWLDLAGLTVEAQALRDLRRIVDVVAASEAGPVVHAARDAAWDAARDAARAGAWDAAWDAAGDAAWDAAWAGAPDAAGAAARAGAYDAARDAARAAARDALKPTIEVLQASALELLDRMIDPAKAAS